MNTKTAEEILHKHFHHFNSERTRSLVIKCMEEYAAQSASLATEGREVWEWVKASERMPELYPVNNTDQLHFELDGRKVDGYFLHSRCFEYFNNEIAGYSQIDFDDFARIEWLERHPSQPLGGYTKEQVGEYGRSILKSISETFLNPENINRADRQSDRDVFQAMGETIINFPLPDLPTPTAPIPAERDENYDVDQAFGFMNE